ncbi:MAG: NYN domain-containing protein [Clostridiales bacterium]|nr:NYN domain-containing protein [Clostridiales bacterium]
MKRCSISRTVPCTPAASGFAGTGLPSASDAGRGVCASARAGGFPFPPGGRSRPGAGGFAPPTTDGTQQTHHRKKRYPLENSKFALFVDLENCGAKVATLLSVLEKVKIRGDILLGKVYGYTDQYSDLKEVLLSNTFTVVPSLRWGISQKNNADILLVIDALEVAYTNPLINSFCIVSGDSDYTPLVGRLKSMGKFVLGISRSEAASSIFINACNEFQFLENVGVRTRKPEDKKKTAAADKEPLDEQELNKLIENILDEQIDQDEIYASELKGILLRLRPDFNERAFGCATFLKLLDKLAHKYGNLRIRNDNFNVMVSLGQPAKDAAAPQLTKENWKDVFRGQLQRYKDDGFDRINPSILKADIQVAYPDFSERALGFKRFSDVLKALEKDKLLEVEMDEQKTMLIKVP